MEGPDSLTGVHRSILVRSSPPRDSPVPRPFTSWRSGIGHSEKNLTQVGGPSGSATADLLPTRVYQSFPMFLSPCP